MSVLTVAVLEVALGLVTVSLIVPLWFTRQWQSLASSLLRVLYLFGVLAAARVAAVLLRQLLGTDAAIMPQRILLDASFALPVLAGVIALLVALARDQRRGTRRVDV